MSKYSSEFKISVAREYLQGNVGTTYLASKYGLNESMVRFWCSRYQLHGAKAFTKTYSNYTPEFKISVLEHMAKHHLSYTQTAVFFDLRGGSGVVSQWQRLYDKGGINALKPRQKGRPKTMKKTPKPSSIKPTSAEQELEALRAEVAYLRAENDYLKKLDDLLREKEQSVKKPSQIKKKPKPSKY